MHKKLEAELVSLAHSILQMKNKDDVNALHNKAHLIYEKLSVLKFVEEYVNTTPTAKQSKEEIIAGIEEVLVEEESHVEIDSLEDEIDTVNEADQEENETIKGQDEAIEEAVEEEVEEALIASDDEAVPELEVEEEIDVNEELEHEDEEPVVLEKEESSEENSEIEFEKEEEIVIEFNPSEGSVEKVVEEPNTLFSLEEEFKDAISADVATELFEKATKEDPVVKSVAQEVAPKKRSLNDALLTNNLQVGLNDRIAFVKHLFDGSQEDFNRVWSQLNSFKSESEAKNFISKLVKPDYDWSEKEEFEQRLIDLIERKFA